ncbi:unnamed protein product, partial [Prorocentrum cordatum]
MPAIGLDGRQVGWVVEDCEVMLAIGLDGKTFECGVAYEDVCESRAVSLLCWMALLASLVAAVFVAREVRVQCNVFCLGSERGVVFDLEGAFEGLGVACGAASVQRGVVVETVVINVVHPESVVEEQEVTPLVVAAGRVQSVDEEGHEVAGVLGDTEAGALELLPSVPPFPKLVAVQVQVGGLACEAVPVQLGVGARQVLESSFVEADCDAGGRATAAAAAWSSQCSSWGSQRSRWADTVDDADNEACEVEVGASTLGFTVEASIWDKVFLDSK